MYLVCMRGCHNDHRTSPRDLPGTAGVDFAEEEVNENGEGP